MFLWAEYLIIMQHMTNSKRRNATDYILTVAKETLKFPPPSYLIASIVSNIYENNLFDLFVLTRFVDSFHSNTFLFQKEPEPVVLTLSYSWLDSTQILLIQMSYTLNRNDLTFYFFITLKLKRVQVLKVTNYNSPTENQFKTFTCTQTFSLPAILLINFNTLHDWKITPLTSVWNFQQLQLDVILFQLKLFCSFYKECIPNIISPRVYFRH